MTYSIINHRSSICSRFSIPYILQYVWYFCNQYSILASNFDRSRENIVDVVNILKWAMAIYRWLAIYNVTKYKSIKVCLPAIDFYVLNQYIICFWKLITQTLRDKMSKWKKQWIRCIKIRINLNKNNLWAKSFYMKNYSQVESFLNP